MSAIPALKSIPCQPLELVQVARRLGEQFSTRAAQFDDSDEFVGENFTHPPATFYDPVRAHLRRDVHVEKRTQ